MLQLEQKETRLISDIIYAAYAVPESPEEWSEIMNLMTQLIPGDALGLAFFEAGSGKVSGDSVYRGADKSFHEDYVNYYQAKDVLTRIASSKKLDVWRTIDAAQNIAWWELEFYCDYVFRYGFGQSLAFTVFSGEEMLAQGWMLRARGGEGFSDRQAKLMSLLQPHFASAIHKSMLFEELKTVKDALQAGLDQVAKPIFLFNYAGKLLEANQTARDQFADLQNQQGDLLACMQEAVRAHRERQSDRKSSGSASESICSCGGRKYRLSVFSPNSSSVGRSFCVRVERVADALRAGLERAFDTHRLSRREVEICEMLAKGMSNRQIADGLSLSEFTVKDHLKSIFGKLEVSNRNQVAAKILDIL
jgi:DNA-binding CsgD family transcriptional regulator